MYKPPFNISPKILSHIGEIQEILGELKQFQLPKTAVKLRRENKIKTVHHSLAIEGNNLSEKQITALIEKKRVIGPKKQIQEVLNALNLYDQIETLDPLKEKELLKAHGTLMKDLVLSAGKYRHTGVGIIKGNMVGHVAPQAKMVPKLMKDLFDFLQAKNDVPFLIKACVFHYELEFIHPFEDGNGRIGRLWQQALLMRQSPLFEYISVETLIHKKQQQYYKVLEQCDKKGDSTLFVEFSLELILKALKLFQKNFRPSRPTNADRIALALEHFGKQKFSRKDYMIFHKAISTATASRDLVKAVVEKRLKKVGDKALAEYHQS